MWATERPLRSLTPATASKSTQRKFPEKVQRLLGTWGSTTSSAYTLTSCSLTFIQKSIYKPRGSRCGLGCALNIERDIVDSPTIGKGQGRKEEWEKKQQEEGREKGVQFQLPNLAFLCWVSFQTFQQPVHLWVLHHIVDLSVAFYENKTSELFYKQT